EDVEELVIADARRVEQHLHGLGVAGTVRRHLLVRRVLLGPAGVAGGHGEHAGDALEGGLHAPEAAAREGRDRALAGLLGGRLGGARVLRWGAGGRRDSERRQHAARARQHRYARHARTKLSMPAPSAASSKSNSGLWCGASSLRSGLREPRNRNAPGTASR